MSDVPVDYYAILETSSTATAEQIRTAYKKAALKHHPDRVPSDSPERTARTKKFQQINDAYYTLSDPSRRRDYDAARQFHFGDTTSEPDFDDDDEDDKTSSSSQRPKKGGSRGGFPWSSFGFGGSGGGANAGATANERSNAQFSSAFEEMMRDAEWAEETTTEDGQRTTRGNHKLWSVIGTLSGGALGFIVANMAGAAAGAAAGWKLGSIRDVHKKPVYQVFQELDQNDRAKLLGELFTKLFAQAISS